MGGLFAIGLGVWVLAQVLGGDALGRLGVLPRDESRSYGGGQSDQGGGSGGGAGGGGSW